MTTAETMANHYLRKALHVHDEAERDVYRSIAAHFEEFDILPACLECIRACKQWDARAVGLSLFECKGRQNEQHN